jgi:ABC-type oligopeptide transport system substrate-binding subunit/predicted Ser/Thr protein kinase
VAQEHRAEKPVIGTCINDRYRLDAELGQGGMGVVYRAHDTLLDRPVAVKVVSKASLGTEGRARLMHEAKAAAQLNHPNIIAIYDAGQSEGLPFIVMELVEGPSLYQHRPADLHEIISYARHICAALDHAHARGIIHRDLKPENVVIAPDGTAKLTDFGLARSVASRITDQGAIVGSVFYLAPELALGKEYDGRADLYALGVMLYELATGRLPFTAEDPLAVISQHLHAPVIPPRAKKPQLPAALDALIVRLLSKDPQDRPASAASVLRELEQPGLLDRDAVPARELSVLERIERGRMVGRERELQQATALWSRALDGEGRMLLISGEPGIGKTRLVRELMTHVEVSGGRALVGASYAEGGTPYAPFRQIIRQVLRSVSPEVRLRSVSPQVRLRSVSPEARLDTTSVHSEHGLGVPAAVLADLLMLAPELRSNFPELPPRPEPDPQAEQPRLMENLLIFFSTLSHNAPLLLVLEDAHWADSGSLSLLRHLARHARHQQLMTVATYREVELDQARPLHEVLLDLQRERLAIRIKLPRLNRTQTAELLEALFAEPITPELLDGIYRETEGNPFFIEEVCKALVESGGLYFEEGRWHRPSVEELGIPQSVRVAIQARVARLSEQAQDTLRLAAILGRQFALDTLAQAIKADEDRLIDDLESAERSQLIEQVSGEEGGTFAFAHGLIPSTLVDGLRTLQRRRLHHRAAQAIEARHPDDFEALAHHYTQAGQAEKAIEYVLKAGDRARGLYAHQEAVKYYQQALEFLKQAGDAERAARTLMKLALAHHNAFDFKAARQTYQEGFVVWQRAAQTVLVAPLKPAPHPLRAPWSEPLTLDPSMAGDGASAAVIEELFAGLVARSPDMGIVPDIARTWEVLEDGRKYVFRLREDARWSDGTPLTARDFVCGWQRVLDPDSGSPNAALLYDVKGAQAFHEGRADWAEVGVRAVDKATFEVQLARPTGYFLQLLACVAAFPVPRHVVEELGIAWTDLENIVTSGPFLLRSWERGHSMAFERNPGYHGSSSGNVQQVEVSLLSDPSRRLELYEADRLDTAGVSSAEMQRARQWHAGEYVMLPSPVTVYLGLDVRRPPFDDRSARQALAMAIDRERLAHSVRQGDSFPASGGFVPPGLPGHSPGIGLPHDPQRARALLAEAGYPGGRGFPLVRLPASHALAADAMFLQEQWRQNLGIEISVQRKEQAAYAQDRERERPQMFLSGWHADYSDPDNFLRVGFPWASSGWHNEAYEKLVEDARQVADQGARMQLYEEADRIVVDEAPIVPLVYGRWHLLVKPWVRKFPTSPIKLWFWKDVVLDPH